jgi:hypothetical protein
VANVQLSLPEPPASTSSCNVPPPSSCCLFLHAAEPRCLKKPSLVAHSLSHFIHTYFPFLRLAPDISPLPASSLLRLRLHAFAHATGPWFAKLANLPKQRWHTCFTAAAARSFCPSCSSSSS